LAKVFDSRETKNVLKFLEIVHKKLNVKRFISDGALGNISDVVKGWMIEIQIFHHVTSRHHHCSNGRIERFNRTIGEGLRKQNIESKLKKRYEKYNKTVHSAIGITPEETLDIENLSEVKKRHFENRVERYKNLFSKAKECKLHLNDKVLIEDHLFKI
jgi:hypothetical protein